MEIRRAEEKWISKPVLPIQQYRYFTPLTLCTYFQFVATTAPLPVIGVEALELSPGKLSRLSSNWSWSRRIPMEAADWLPKAAVILIALLPKSTTSARWKRKWYRYELFTTLKYKVKKPETHSPEWHAIRAFSFVPFALYFRISEDQ